MRDGIGRQNVVGYIALFVALSGPAWAATELSKNEVKSKHIGKGQVKSSDLADDSVTSPKVADRSLLSEDLALGPLPQGPQGFQGEQGPQGLQGDPGPLGPSSSSSLAGGGFVPDAPPNDADVYCGPTTVQAANSCIADEETQRNERAAMSPNATIVARDLFIKQAGASGGSRTYTLRVEGTDTAVSCTLDAIAQTCNSGGATATIQPGSRILLHIVSSNPNPNGFWFGWRATTP